MKKTAPLLCLALRVNFPVSNSAQVYAVYAN